jgi:hypothetical protein
MRRLLLQIAMAAAVVLSFAVAVVQASAAPTGATASGAVAYYDDGFNAGWPTPGPTDPNGPPS